MSKLAKWWHAIRITTAVIALVGTVIATGVFIYLYIKGVESLGPLLAGLIKGNR